MVINKRLVNQLLFLLAIYTRRRWGRRGNDGKHLHASSHAMCVCRRQACTRDECIYDCFAVVNWGRQNQRSDLRNKSIWFQITESKLAC